MGYRLVREYMQGSQEDMCEPGVYMHRAALLRGGLQTPGDSFRGAGILTAYCYKTKMLFAFFTVFTFALMAEAVVGKTVGALALSQAATDGTHMCFTTTHSTMLKNGP